MTRHTPRRRDPNLRAHGLGALAICTCAGALLCTTAHAGPVEQMVDIGFGPGTPASIVVRYENGGGGLIYGREGDAGDAGREGSEGKAGNVEAGGAGRWLLQCGSAYLAPGERARGPLVVLSDGTTLVASASSIFAISPDGCAHAQEVKLEEGAVYDVVADPTEGNAALALISVPGKPSSRSVVWRRSPDGEWAAIGDASDPAAASSIRAVDREGQLRIYQTAQVPMQDDDAGPTYFVYQLRYSDDGAATFQAFPLAADSPPRVVGVDPSNPDRIVVLLDRSTGDDAIVVSDDAGAHFKPYLELAAFGGIAFAPDGRVWIGGSDGENKAHRGLWAAANLSAAPERLAEADYGVQCLQYHAPSDKLYACQHFWLGEVDLTSGSFSTLVTFATVSELVDCQQAAASCEQQLCADFCGPAHFASAPVCSVYDKPNCGRPVAAREGGAESGASVDARASASAEPESPTSATDAAVPALFDAGDPPAAVSEPQDDASCSVERPRARPVPAAWLSLITLALAWRLGRRRGRSG